MPAHPACRLARGLALSLSLLVALAAAGNARATSVHGNLHVGARVVERCQLGADDEVRVSCGRHASGSVVVVLPDGTRTAPLSATGAHVVVERARAGGGTLTIHF